MMGQSRWAQVVMNRKREIALVAFALSVLGLIAAQLAIAQVNGPWVDELFSLWASDPALPAGELFSQRIFRDSNPPLYFSLLRAVRTFFEDPRAAFIAVSAFCAAAACAYVIWVSWRAGMIALGLWGAAAFLLSGPALCYFPEGRSYFAAMCVVFAAAWASGLALTVNENGGAGRAPPWAHFAALGVLASLAHVFSGVMAGGLGAGLLGIGVFARRRDLIAPGLMIGVATTLSFGLWFAHASAFLGNVGWIEFTPALIREALWLVKTLTFNSNALMAAALLLYAFGLYLRSTRLIAVLFGVALFLFAALPLAASFVTPIIVGRYWLVGAPVLIALNLFLIAAFLRLGSENFSFGDFWRNRPLVAGAALIAITLASNILGFGAAYRLTADKPIWRGGAIVESLAADCPPHSVRVTGNPPFLPAYAENAGVDASLFVDATDDDVAIAEASEAQCKVIGWGEHVPMDDASDAMLLEWLKLDAEPDEIAIWRSNSGYVVMQPDATE